MPAPAIEPSPDFERFRQTLTRQRSWRRPPLFDFLIDRSHKRDVLGRPVKTATDEVEFFTRAGYDYAQASLYVPIEELQEALRKSRESGSAIHGGSLAVIESLDQFKRRRWSWQPVADGDLTAVADKLEWMGRLAEALPESMKLLVHFADVFTFAWEMIGFDEFCLATYEAPALIEAVMGSMAMANLNVAEEAVRRCGEKIGVVMYSDDIAYTEGLMLSPDFFRKALFPFMGELAERGRCVDAPMIYHSDGRLYQVLDDLAALGVNGIQPLEPKSMDPREIKDGWPNTFCLLGNIDLDLMARGAPEQVEQHVRERIERINADGGYMPGVSNTVPDYVDHANYIRMIETVYSYSDEPL